MFRAFTAIVIALNPAIVFAHEGHGSAQAMTIAHTMLDHGIVLAIAAIVGAAVASYKRANEQ